MMEISYIPITIFLFNRNYVFAVGSIILIQFFEYIFQRYNAQANYE